MTTARNPLIIAIALAGVVRSLGLELPQVLLQTGDILAGLTLPLALIGIGASLTMSRALVADSVVWSAVVLKLVVLPTLIIVSAVFIGITGAALGVIALMFASPTAAAAFVMAKSMKADSRLTADVIALSTLGSGVTVTTIIYVLNLSGLL
jgi:predicted permease